MSFAPEYVRLVLSENFEDAKALFIEPLMAIHYAHLAMLAEQGIVTPDDAGAIRRALDAIDRDALERASVRRILRGPVLLREPSARRGVRRRTSPAGSTPRAAATTST